MNLYSQNGQLVCLNFVSQGTRYLYVLLWGMHINAEKKGHVLLTLSQEGNCFL